MPKKEPDVIEALSMPTVSAPPPTHKPVSATFADGVLTVAVKDGSPIRIPGESMVLCNGVANGAANVPGWLEGVAKRVKEVAAENVQRVAIGLGPNTVPPVTMTVTDTGAGLFIRFDQG